MVFLVATEWRLAAVLIVSRWCHHHRGSMRRRRRPPPARVGAVFRTRWESDFTYRGDAAALFVWRTHEAIAPFGRGSMADTVTSLAWIRATRVLVACDASGLVRAFRVPWVDSRAEA
jgi:hypothetical protein